VRGAARAIARLLALGVFFVLAVDLLLPRTRAQGPAPDFSLRSLDGERVRLSSLRGQPVVLNFWATWCGPCEAEIPELNAFAAAHPAIPVLGVAVDGKRRALLKARASWGIRYPVLLGAQETLEAYAVSSVPTTVVIDGEGAVIWGRVGTVDQETLEGVLTPSAL